MPEKKTLYTGTVKNSVLELFEENQNFRASSVLPISPDETINEFIGSIDFPKRDFWEQAEGIIRGGD